MVGKVDFGSQLIPINKMVYENIKYSFNYSSCAGFYQV
jgi:hypothetical protein